MNGQAVGKRVSSADSGDHFYRDQHRDVKGVVPNLKSVNVGQCHLVKSI